MRGMTQTVLAIVLSVMSMIGTAIGTLYMEYANTDKAMTARIVALEAHRADDASKLDHIQAQVDRLVEWAIGHK